MMKQALMPLARHTNLLPGLLRTRRERNYKYLMELTTDNLLQAYRHEAGLFSTVQKLENCHWGWDGPLSDLRGQFTGHWLSAAARMIQSMNDRPLKEKADFIVSEIARCQMENGGEWGFPIPQNHLYWLKRGKHTWAPQYVCHKCMMGLLDMYRYAGNTQALEVLCNEAQWFVRFTDDISRETMDDMMDWEETGGIMELWADLYAITNDPKHLLLMRRYERPRLYEPLLRGEDVLTNMHANTTIPEIHGAARAYEVTGEVRYRQIVEQYWALAVTKRGFYATGGQTDGEIWTPPYRQAARLSARNQEHCVVYNMMRLSEYLFRWTGDATYADYYERNLLNGILAQTFWQDESDAILHTENATPDEGLVAYYLGLSAGSTKRWGSKTESFWCCHCTAVQSNAMLHEGIFYQDGHDLYLCQFASASCTGKIDGAEFTLRVELDDQTAHGLAYDPIRWKVPTRPKDIVLRITIRSDQSLNLRLHIRKPWWIDGDAAVGQNGLACDAMITEHGFYRINGTFQNDTLVCTFPKRLTTHPLADDPEMVAFLDGPVVLAGLCTHEYQLQGDPAHPENLLQPDHERQWDAWMPSWKTKGQRIGLRFRPLYDIGREAYTVYFPVRRDIDRPEESR